MNCLRMSTKNGIKIRKETVRAYSIERTSQLFLIAKTWLDLAVEFYTTIGSVGGKGKLSSINYPKIL